MGQIDDEPWSAPREHLYDDNGDSIGTRQFVLDEGLPSSDGDGLRVALGVLAPEEVSELFANRSIIERAKGMLMVVYGVDSDDAFELLKLRSQTTGGELRWIARQIVREFHLRTVRQPPPALAGYDDICTRCACVMQSFEMDPQKGRGTEAPPCG